MWNVTVFIRPFGIFGVGLRAVDDAVKWYGGETFQGFCDTWT